jgi:hypothetical protein
MDSCGENDLVYWRIWNGNLNRKMIRWSGIYIYIYVYIYICVCLYIYISRVKCVLYYGRWRDIFGQSILGQTTTMW